LAHCFSLLHAGFLVIDVQIGRVIGIVYRNVITQLHLKNLCQLLANTYANIYVNYLPIGKENETPAQRIGIADKV